MIRANRHSFTIVELLVVMAIIGVLLNGIPSLVKRSPTFTRASTTSLPKIVNDS